MQQDHHMKRRYEGAWPTGERALSWRAVCEPCGWVGPIRLDPREAEDDADRHCQQPPMTTRERLL
jgi:hypothetical protein